MAVDLTQVLTAAGVGAVVVEAIRSVFQRKKMRADEASVISSAAVSLLQPLEKRIHELEDELDKTKLDLMAVTSEWNHTKRELREARTEVRALRAEAASGREEIRRGPHYYDTQEEEDKA